MGKILVRHDALKAWRVPGAEHQVRPVHDIQEHRRLLVKKLWEEVVEVAEAVQDGNQLDILKELADVTAVLEGIADTHGISWAEVRNMMAARERVSGNFNTGMVWENDR